MKATQSSTVGAVRYAGLGRFLVLFCAIVCVDLSVLLRDKLLGGDEPQWICLALVALPWLVFGLCLLFYRRRVWRADELERLINHGAIAFAFYVMFIGVLVIGQLQAAKLIPVFEWTVDRLTMSMAGTVLVGLVWNKTRFS